MKYIVCEKPGQFLMKEKAEPRVHANEVLLQIKTIGICGTDLHAFAGNQAFFKYPHILGHELGSQVLKIGKIATQKEEVHGEFIGMIKLNNRGTEIFKKHFYRVKKTYWGKPFQRAKIFQKAYLTDMIQELVDNGVKVHCVIIERGWKEIDTVEDYKKALIEFK